MKRRSLWALTIAVVFHLLILALIWLPERTRKEPEPLLQRFGIRFSDPLALPESPPSANAFPKGIPTEPPSPSPATDTAVSPSVEAPSPITEPKPFTPADRDALPRSVLHHYGEEFFDLSAAEQHYIVNNLQRIRKINEIVGTRLLRERPDEEIDPEDSNIVEFTLHPDGTVTDLRLHRTRVGSFLDELTLQTITLAHERYPKPEQKTRIKIRVYIVVR